MAFFMNRRKQRALDDISPAKTIFIPWLPRWQAKEWLSASMAALAPRY